MLPPFRLFMYHEILRNRAPVMKNLTRKSTEEEHWDRFNPTGDTKNIFHSSQLTRRTRMKFVGVFSKIDTKLVSHKSAC